MMSLHARIVAEIEGSILSGKLIPGDRLPFEAQLALDYGCSRMTVNKAMTQLVAAGLIERRRKSGTFVRTPAGESAVLEISSIPQEIARLGLPYRYKLRTRRERPSTR